jgi:hypothetical protein
MIKKSNMPQLCIRSVNLKAKRRPEAPLFQAPFGFDLCCRFITEYELIQNQTPREPI